MKNLSKKIFLLVSALMLLLPALTTNIKQDQKSSFDNRRLLEFPAPDEDNFRISFESYLSDRIGFREAMITAYQNTCSVLFHKLVHPSFIYGKEGHIVAPWDLVTYQHLDVSEDYLAAYTDYVSSLKYLCDRNDMDFLYLMIPNKETIYPEAFPDGYNIKNQPNRTDKLLERLSKKSVEYLTPIDLFLSIKKDHLLYNYIYDAGHWNYNGCFYCHQMVLDRICEDYPGAGKLDLSEFDRSEVLREYLGASRFRIDEMVPYYTPVNTNAVSKPEWFDRIALTTKYQYHYYYENEEAAQRGAPKILIFGDSFLEGDYIFYMNHASELLMLHAEFMRDAEYYISVFQPDLVIYEAAERALETEWDDFKYGKSYYCSEDLPDEPEDPGQAYKKEIILPPSSEYLRNRCLNEDYVSFSGNMNEFTEDPNEILTMIARLNGKDYFPQMDKDNCTYQFTFRKSDVMNAEKITYYAVTK